MVNAAALLPRAAGAGVPPPQEVVLHASTWVGSEVVLQFVSACGYLLADWPMDRRQNLKLVASATSMTTGVSAGPPGAIRKQTVSAHGQSGKDDDLRRERMSSGTCG